MAGSVNKVILLGNLGRDPEVRHSQDGAKIVNLNVATSETWKDKNGERQERTEWHRVVIFSPALADVAEKYLKKGSKVYVEGQLRTRKWTDQAGNEKYSTEVVLSGFNAVMVLADRPSGENGFGQAAGGESGGGSSGWDTSETPAAAKDIDDEIPF
jgi:single-strand DNA-binding protein